MLNKWAERITNRLLKKQIIEQESVDIYKYGVYQLLTNLMNAITTILLGLVFGEVLISIIFVLAFMVLRIYAGGYHASTAFRCYLLTVGAITLTLLATKYIELPTGAILVLLILSSSTIVMLAPVENRNKGLDNIEQVIYQKRALIVWGIESICALVMLLVGAKKLLLCITMSYCISAISLIAGKVDIEIQNGRNRIKKA